MTLLLMQACMPSQKSKSMSKVILYLAVALTILSMMLSDFAGLD